MAITININTPNATININSSKDSGFIPNQEPSKKTHKNTGPHFLVTDEVVKNIKCDHRGEDGHFDVDCLAFPSIYRCRRCNEPIDLKTQYDPAFVKKVIGYLWKAFQAMKTNNTEESMKEVLDSIGISLYLVKENMPKTLEIIDDNLANAVISRNPKIPPFTPNMNDPFFNSSEFSRFFDSESPFPDRDKKDTPPKKDEKPPAKPKEQTPPSSK